MLSPVQRTEVLCPSPALYLPKASHCPADWNPSPIHSGQGPAGPLPVSVVSSPPRTVLKPWGSPFCSLTTRPGVGPLPGCNALPRLLIYHLRFHLLGKALSDSWWISLQALCCLPRSLGWKLHDSRDLLSSSTLRTQFHLAPGAQQIDKYLRNEGFKDRNGLCPQGVYFLFPTVMQTTKTTVDCDKCHEINKQQMCGLKPKNINPQGWARAEMPSSPISLWCLSRSMASSPALPKSGNA